MLKGSSCYLDAVLNSDSFDQVAAQIDAMFKVAFDEDKAILEAIQAEEERAASPPTLRLAIDKGANVYRKRIDRLIEAESLQAAE